MLLSIPRATIYYPLKKIPLDLFNLLLSDSLKNNSTHLFKESIKKSLHLKNITLTSSATTALIHCLRALDLPKESEVMVQAYNVPEVIAAIIHCKLKPVFIDIEHESFNIDPTQIQTAITNKTRVILITHMYGTPCKIDKIKEIAQLYGLQIIEDCAQAFGAEYKNIKVGNFGDLAYFSFNQFKNINTCGGGAISARSEILHKKLISMNSRHQAASKQELTKKYLKMITLKLATTNPLFTCLTLPALKCLLTINPSLSQKMLKNDKISPLLNSKNIPDNLKTEYSQFQAEIGMRCLRTIDETTNKRIKNATLLKELLPNSATYKIPYNTTKTKNTHLNFPIIVKKSRSFIIKAACKKGIDLSFGHMIDCASHPSFYSYNKHCPQSIRAQTEHLYLPIYPSLSEKHITYIAKTIMYLL